jgi:hypothetical protein
VTRYNTTLQGYYGNFPYPYKTKTQSLLSSAEASVGYEASEEAYEASEAAEASVTFPEIVLHFPGDFLHLPGDFFPDRRTCPKM